MLATETQHDVMGKCNELKPSGDKLVNGLLLIVKARHVNLVNDSRVRLAVEIVTILCRSKVSVGIEVVMTQKLVLVHESIDKVGAVDGECLRHVRSMAENGADCKRWWTVS